VGGGGLFCCPEGDGPSEIVVVQSERLINHQPDSTDFVDAETTTVLVKRSPGCSINNLPSVYYKEIDFSSAGCPDWGATIKMDNIDNCLIIAVKAAKRFSNSGVQAGWKIRAINGEAFNRRNLGEHIQILRNEYPCTILFEYEDPLDYSWQSLDPSTYEISQITNISDVQLPVIFSSQEGPLSPDFDIMKHDISESRI